MAGLESKFTSKNSAMNVLNIKYENCAKTSVEVAFKQRFSTEEETDSSFYSTEKMSGVLARTEDGNLCLITPWGSPGCSGFDCHRLVVGGQIWDNLHSIESFSVVGGYQDPLPTWGLN